MTKDKKNSNISNLLLWGGLLLLLLLGWNIFARRHDKAADLQSVNTISIDSLMMVDMDADVVSELLKYPGFIVSFNADYRQPNWVAWELTRDECRKAETSRKSAQFMPDFNVRGCAQLEDYRNSGFDRGHMCPAGDMRWSQDAMNSCFLLTNMSPQNHDLNSGAWAALEEKCREWAERDSAVVIICGPVLSDKMPRTIGVNKVPVPERFFKIVLSPYTQPIRCIGFVMPNANVVGGMQQSAVSVDEIEYITGYDFFSILPDAIEDKIESECNFPLWSKKR